MWTFQQTGHLITPSGQPAANPWYSGHGDHANVPADEGLVGLGPIPCGSWSMVALVRDTHMGPVAIRLQPDTQTAERVTALGRDPNSFYIHDGDRAHDHLASEGCLVSVEGTGPVLDIWESGDRQLLVASGLE